MNKEFDTPVYELLKHYCTDEDTVRDFATMASEPDDDDEDPVWEAVDVLDFLHELCDDWHFQTKLDRAAHVEIKHPDVWIDGYLMNNPDVMNSLQDCIDGCLGNEI